MIEGESQTGLMTCDVTHDLNLMDSQCPRDIRVPSQTWRIYKDTLH